MCLAAIHWSGIEECYFIADRKCAGEYGFDDNLLYEELIKPISQRKMAIVQHDDLYSEVKNLFETWKQKGLPLC